MAGNLSSDGSKEMNMIIKELSAFSNIFASEFNKADIHDRVLCFEVIKEEGLETKVDSEGEDDELNRKTDTVGCAVVSPTTFKDEHEIDEKNEPDAINEKKAENVEIEDANTVEKVLSQDEKEPRNMADEDQKPQNQTDEHQEMDIQNDEAESNGDKDTTKKTSDVKDDEVISAVRKLFVHSQWLSVQSTYFKALFYSGMKETYSKEVAMKIYEHELEAHLVLIEAMYKPDVLKDKNYHLIVQVLILANKYDVPLVTTKCKSFLIAKTPSLEMCEYILQQTEHLTEMALVHDMLQRFLVEEFFPFDKIWTTKKFTRLSEVALRLLLKSDDLATQSENTIFVALMEWVELNIPDEALNKCDLLNVVKFEFMSVDFLYDVVQHHNIGNKMPGFTKHLLKGLAYHGFSTIRQEKLQQKPKKRPYLKSVGPTYIWVIDDKLAKMLSNSPEKRIISDVFFHQGYQMVLGLAYSKNLDKSFLQLAILNLEGDEACLSISLKAKSSIFHSEIFEKKNLWYTASRKARSVSSRLERNQSGKGFEIYVWVEIS